MLVVSRRRSVLLGTMLCLQELGIPVMQLWYPEGRLRASHCQIIDPLKGVVVTDFNSGRDELRCLVPWGPWEEGCKIECYHSKGARKGRFDLEENYGEGRFKARRRSPRYA